MPIFKVGFSSVVLLLEKRCLYNCVVKFFWYLGLYFFNVLYSKGWGEWSISLDTQLFSQLLMQPIVIGV